MRPLLLALLSATTTIGALACSSSAVGTAETKPTKPPTAAPLVCAARDPSICGGLERITADSPSRVNAIAWAQVETAPTAPGRAGDAPKIALYEDGTLGRTSVLRNLTYFLTPPRGLVVANVAPASIARIRADVAAVTREDLQGFFGPDEQVSRDGTGSRDLLHVPNGSACFNTHAESSACATAAVLRLRDDMNALAAAAEVKWRDAQVGTVSIGVFDVQVRGDWPLAEERAVEGSSTLSRTEWNRVGGTGLFRLQSGGYVEIDFVSEDKGVEGGPVTVFSSRQTAVPLVGDLAGLRAELLANEGRYHLTHGAWLGVELGEDRFPAFKNRDYVVLPATGGAPASLRSLYAIERLDLRASGAVSLP